MRRSHKIIAAVVGAGAVLTAISLPHDKNCVLNKSCVAPLSVYPNPILTTGVVATTDFKELTAVNSCGTYSQCHRKTTSQMKDQVCSEYPTNCQSGHEIDHFCPLALGCADDVKNLWAEPEHLMVNGEDLGYHTKDRLEAFLVNQMKKGLITPSDAQNCVLNDWVACMRKYLSGNGGYFGAITTDPDQ